MMYVLSGGPMCQCYHASEPSVLLHAVCRTMLPEVHETLCKSGCTLCGAYKCSRTADAASHEPKVGNQWCACQDANDELQFSSYTFLSAANFSQAALTVMSVLRGPRTIQGSLHTQPLPSMVQTRYIYSRFAIAFC